MILFSSSYSQRAPKISFYFIFPIQRPFSPSSLCNPLLCVQPTRPLAQLLGPGVTTPLGSAAAVQGRMRAVQSLGARASFWRKALARRGRGRHAGPICICFYSISTPCTLTLSGKSLLESLLGAERGEEAGPEWKVPAWQGQPLPGQ